MRPRTQILYFIIDVVSMYTSIPIVNCIRVIDQLIIKYQSRNPLRKFIIKSLEIVLTINYFKFDDLIYKQKNGIAMGTPVAPIIATLYMAYYEEVFILESFKESLHFYKRYLDDIFIIWIDNNNKPYEFNRFKAILKRIEGLKFTINDNNKVNFLDL